MSKQQSKKNKLNLWDGLSLSFAVQGLFCLFPLKRQGNQIGYSSLAAAFSIVSSFGYLFTLILAIYLYKTEQTTQTVESVGPSRGILSRSYLIIVIAVFEFIFTNVGVLVMISFSHFKKNDHILFLQKLYDIDMVIIHELKMDINYWRLRRVCYVAYSLIFIYYVPFAIFVFCKINSYESLTPGTGLLALLYQFEKSATAIVTWTFVLYVMLLRHRFAFLRKRQENLVKERKMFLKTGVAYTENIPTLSTLLMTYKELCSCIDVLNSLMGSILIIRVAHDFTLTTSQAYLISWILMDNNSDDKFKFAFEVFVWMLPNLVKMVLTTLMTEYTIDEAKACSYTINKSNKANIDNEDAQVMLDGFDQWLLHRKIEFNANNFFKIDLNLLYGIIGALTSYVLILIQFKQQEETLTTDMNSTAALK